MVNLNSYFEVIDKSYSLGLWLKNFAKGSERVIHALIIKHQPSQAVAEAITKYKMPNSHLKSSLIAYTRYVLVQIVTQKQIPKFVVVNQAIL